jgi:hypothetical protein
MQSLVFCHKKSFTTKFEFGPQKERLKYLIFEDLSRINLSKMQVLAADSRVGNLACKQANPLPDW